MNRDTVERLKAWAILVLLAALLASWGLFLFFRIGDRGQPRRNFGAVRDVPGESPYSTERN